MSTEASNTPARPQLPQRFTAHQLFDMEIPEQQYLVPGLIPYGLITLVGKSKIGKSWLSLQLALAVATGGTFLGQQVTQGDALYLALEDVPGRLQGRLRLLGAASGDWAEQLEFWLNHPDAIEDTLADIERWLCSAKNPQLVCVDVMGRILPQHSGRDEYLFYTHIFEKIQTLAQRFEVTVLLVHHAKKGPNLSGDPFDQVLGSTAIMSNSDATLLLERGRNEQQGLLHVTGRDIEERQVNLRRDGVRWELSAEDVQPALSSARQGIIDAVQDGAKTPAEITQRTGRERGAVQQILKTLVDEGLLTKVDRGHYDLPESSHSDIADFAHISPAHVWAAI
ncbi:AAA family ATPase [Deinococcus arenicola]|uniref:AAA family ATPase n=1 Tax=Deinococcus arenicola TaxID=2994950 RepID=A0ABU4DLT9_9DEIO|nr:AAA family ATPase [Deinococcus sp. ZS9-10]MDV6373403.1 AAA family ATPase [Deinococcus sp. ZS9-10]